MQQKIAQLVDMLKKQGIPDDMIRMFTTIIAERREELDLTNEETLLASLGKAMEKMMFETFPVPPVSDEDEEYEEDDDDDDDEDWSQCGHYVTPYSKDYPKYLMRRDVKKWTIRISLQGIRPIIWRKLEVPSNISMAFLGFVLLEAMGWENEHLHQFRKGYHFYSPASQQDPDMFPDFGAAINHKSEEFCLSDIMVGKGDKIHFDYDFGDDWHHQILLSSVDKYTKDEPRKVRLIGGKNACPPEDCGGEWGYNTLCEYFRTGKRAEGVDESFYSWVGEDFDPDYFPLEDMIARVDEMND